MQLPGMSEEELGSFLQEPWIAKLGTLNPDGSIQMTPLWFEKTNDVFRFNTWEDTDAARNLQRDSRASLLIDSTEFPYRGVHYTGEAEVDTKESDPEEIAEMYERYRGDYETALEYANELTSFGKRVFIRFRPSEKVTWDFSKG